MAFREEAESSVESMTIRQQWAKEELAEIFKTTLGYSNIGRPDPKGRNITPFRIVTEFRNTSPDLETTWEQTLAELLESQKVPFTTAVRIGVLWGASYGQQTIGDTLTRLIDSYDFSFRKRITVEETVLGITRGIAKAYASEIKQSLVTERNPEGYIRLTRELLRIKPRAPQHSPLRDRLYEIGNDPERFGQLADTLDSIVGQLSLRDQEVLNARMALVGLGSIPEPETSLAEKFSVHPDRVLDIQRRAIRKLRHPPRLNRVLSFFQ